MFDPEKFGDAMADVVLHAITPLKKRIDELEKQLAEKPKEGADGQPGKDGTSISLDDVQPVIDAALLEIAEKADAIIAEAVAAIPDPENGKDGSDGKDGEDGKDGASVTVDDVSSLLEFQVNKWALEFERRAQDTLTKAIDRMPVPKDGKDGVDGADGMGFDDLQIEYDGTRTFSIKMARGELVKRKDFLIPVMIYRGIFKPGDYEPGDTVTFGGSLWHCDESTSDKPGEVNSKGWILAAKRGRDGKDGRDGIDKTLPVKL